MLLFDFGGITNKTPEQLEAHLSDELTKMGKEQGITVKGPSLESQLKALMKALASKGHVVVLIDEYDQPLIDNLHNPEVAEGNRRLLRSFFRALKSLDEYIQFTFITGISKFSRVSIFSGANHLKDISMTTKYATMMGYTQEELVQYFAKHLQAITQKRNAQGQPSTEEAVLAEIKDWYNGYRFLRKQSMSTILSLPSDLSYPSAPCRPYQSPTDLLYRAPSIVAWQGLRDSLWRYLRKNFRYS